MISPNRAIGRIQRPVVFHTAHSAFGPQIALAITEDLSHWKRMGLATFEPYSGIDSAHVVFPAGIDGRVDLGQPDRFDVDCGMAGSRSGVVRLDLPLELPVWKPFLDSNAPRPDIGTLEESPF